MFLTGFIKFCENDLKLFTCLCFSLLQLGETAICIFPGSVDIARTKCYSTQFSCYRVIFFSLLNEFSNCRAKITKIQSYINLQHHETVICASWWHIFHCNRFFFCRWWFPPRALYGINLWHLLKVHSPYFGHECQWCWLLKIIGPILCLAYCCFSGPKSRSQAS